MSQPIVPPSTGPIGWVPASPFRAHLHHLMCATGLPWRAIARYADLPAALLRRLAGSRPPRRLPHHVAARLLQVTVAELVGLENQLVRAAPTVHRLNELAAAGIDTTTLAQMLQLPVERVRSLRSRDRRCSRRIDLLARCAVEAHRQHAVVFHGHVPQAA